jgi:hypothetical protein
LGDYLGHIFDILNNIYSYFIKKLNSNTYYIMPSVKGIGITNYSSRPMEKTTSMNKYVADHGNKTNYNKVGK